MNLSKFLSDALISGHGNGSFTTEQVIIYTQNYYNKAQVTQSDYDRVIAALSPQEV